MKTVLDKNLHLRHHPSIAKKQFTMRAFLPFALTFLVFAQACNEADEMVPPVEATPSAVLVLNEGLFRRGNASISGYDAQSNTALGTVYDPSANLGGGLDILQSTTTLGDTLVLVANNSNSLVLLNEETLAELGRFDALGSPRYLTRMRNGQLLVTDLFANRLLELNPDFTQARVINHEGHAEGLIAHQDGALFTSPSRRAIFYYDAMLGEVTDSLLVPFRANAILRMNDNRIAVCGGILEQGDSGSLAIIDWPSKSIELLVSFSESESSLYPRLALTDDRLYCLQRDLIYLPLSDLTQGGSERIDLSRFADPYGLGIDPATDELYITDAKNGLSLGEAIRLSPDGVPIDSFAVGIFPNGFVFR